MWNEILTQFCSNLASGLVIAFLFFLFSDYIFRIPKLNGSWHFTTTTKMTKYNPYRDMQLTYNVLLWQNGKNIFGSGEKIWENSDGKRKEYTGSQRSIIKLSGYVTKKYLAKDKIVLHYEETSRSRNSSTIHLLKFSGNDLVGDFISTIADSEGEVRWTKSSKDF